MLSKPDKPNGSSVVPLNANAQPQPLVEKVHNLMGKGPLAGALQAKVDDLATILALPTLPYPTAAREAVRAAKHAKIEAETSLDVAVKQHPLMRRDQDEHADVQRARRVLAAADAEVMHAGERLLAAKEKRAARFLEAQGVMLAEAAPALIAVTELFQQAYAPLIALHLRLP